MTKTPLAWRNLVQHPARALAVLAGVTFAIVLIFMQLGFYGSIETTARTIYDALEFDVVIRSREYLHLSDAATLPRERLIQAASHADVAKARPFYAALNDWRRPTDGQSRGMLTMGMNPDDPVFALEEIRSQAHRLRHERAVLVDRASRREFGPRNGQQFGDQDVGVETEIGRSKVRIAGHFYLGSGLAADGAAVLNDRAFHLARRDRTPEEVSLGLVTLREGADAGQVATELAARLPDDVDVLTRRQAIDFELHRWLRDTSIGLIFQVGVVVAMIVGMAIVYQVLSSNIAEHFAEYATLKAMGYSNRFLAWIVLQQSVLLAVLGFVPGVIISLALYALTSYVAELPIKMNVSRIATVFTLALAMCCVAGLVAIRKVRTAEPAELF
jgi:putative ABC transport system permease protein